MVPTASCVVDRNLRVGDITAASDRCKSRLDNGRRWVRQMERFVLVLESGKSWDWGFPNCRRGGYDYETRALYVFSRGNYTN